MTRGRSIPWLLAFTLWGVALIPSCDDGTGGLSGGDGNLGGAGLQTGSGANSGMSGGSSGELGGAPGSAAGPNGSGASANGNGSGSGAQPGQGFGGAFNSFGGSSQGNGGAGTGGGLVLPGDECQSAADCTACAFDTAPRNPGECYCAFCSTVVMSKARCDANQGEFKAQRCDKKVCPKEQGACAAKEVACLPDPNRQGKNRCVDPAEVTASGGSGGGGTGGGGTGGVGGAPANPATVCAVPSDCEMCDDEPIAPASVNECYCPGSVCRMALNKTTCAANQAEFWRICGAYVTASCTNAQPATCAPFGNATCNSQKNECTPLCQYPSAPAAEAECYCAGNRVAGVCSVQLPEATCAANKAAWDQVCAPNWAVQNNSTCSQGTVPFCGENGPRVPAPTECRDNQDCTSCAYPEAPTGNDDCYCLSKACVDLNKVTCEANKAAWDEKCYPWSTDFCVNVQPSVCSPTSAYCHSTKLVCVGSAVVPITGRVTQ